MMMATLMTLSTALASTTFSTPLTVLSGWSGTVPAGISWADLADPSSLLQGAGGWVLLVVGLIVFVESGVLFPFLPGDSLIFTAGLLHASLGVPLIVLIAVIVGAAIAGDQVGYWLGRRFGRKMFRPNARVLNTRYLTAAEAFFTRYGGRSLVLARFVPFARTFVPLAAGTAHYRYRSFLMWNIVGAVLWGVGLTVAGSLLGGVPFIADHVDLIALVIVVVSVVPTVFEVTRHVRRNKAGTEQEQERKQEPASDQPGQARTGTNAVTVNVTETATSTEVDSNASSAAERMFAEYRGAGYEGRDATTDRIATPDHRGEGRGDR